ncbi:MAG TPA: redoxin family protein [Verrucomicrobiota bacterium]|nr:redoxin family protein [Verrucomicrobiota bacterium]
MILRLALASWFSALTTGCVHQADPRPSWSLTTLQGNPVTIQFEADTRAIVFEFLSVECPISNRVEPELDRLKREYTPRGVAFVAVYPNAGDLPEVIREHRAEGSFTPEAFRDPQQTLADQLGIKVTPEVVVFTADGRQVYRGRVNDQYAALGQGKPAPTRHDLAEALAGLTKGTQMEPRSTPPVGCRIQRIP